MSKITTEDCVAELNKSYPGDWKRKSKSGSATTGIRRVFESQGKTAVVLEKDGVLSVESMDGKVIGTGKKECPVCNGDQFLQPCKACGKGMLPVTKVEVPKPVEAPKPVETPKPSVSTENVIPDQVVINFAKKCFGEDPTVFDYKVIAAAITLRAILPPSFATTAMVKALKGTSKAKVGQSNPAFGIVAGMARYTQQGLWNIVQAIHELLESGDVMEKEELTVVDEDSNAPVFLTDYSESQHKVNKEHALAVAKAFEECGVKYGKAAPEPERKKTNNIKPDEIIDKLVKSGVWYRAEKKGQKLIDDFLDEHKGEEWEDAYPRAAFHSRSFKDDILTMSFYLRVKREKYGYSRGVKRRIDPKDWKFEGKAPILISRWKEDGTIIDWEVKLMDFNPSY